MQELIAKVFTYFIIIIIYLFVFAIIRMVYSDIRVMSRKKSGVVQAGAYLKLINLREELDFPVQESYALLGDAIVGRSKKNAITLNDPYLSQENTRIFMHGDTFYIEDLDSTNGTYMNGERIEGDPIEIRDGDKITIGQANFLFVESVKQ